MLGVKALYTFEKVIYNHKNSHHNIKRLEKLSMSKKNKSNELVSDFSKNNTVVQANSLLQQTNNRLELTSLKGLKLFISCIDAQADTMSCVVYLKKSEIMSFFKGGNSYGANIKSDSQNSLMHNAEFFKYQMARIKEQNVIITEKGSTRILSIVREIYWDDDSPMVKVEFEERIMPYLYGLKKNFLSYNILEIQGVKSKYTLILYENLLAASRANHGSKIITIPLEQLRTMVGTTVVDKYNPDKVVMEKYPEFKAFNRSVLKVAVNEINNGMFSFFIEKYEKVKEGRKVTGIVFHLRVRTSYKDTIDFISRPELLKNKI